MKFKKAFWVSIIIIISIAINSCSRNTITHFPEYFKEARKNAPHKNTEWNVRSSVRFDAICFINTLTGEPFYLNYHSKEYSVFEAGMNDSVKESLNRLKQFKDKLQFPLANLLVGYAFVMEEDQTLEDLIRTFENPEQMYKEYLTYSFNSQDSIDNYFKPIREDVVVVLKFLKESGFEEYWAQNIKPDVDIRIEEIRQKVVEFNIVPELEKHLGYGLYSNKMNIYVLGLAQPTAFHFGYDNFITDEAWPAENIYIASIHEPMHPSVDMNDFDIADAILAVKNDKFIADSFEKRNVKYGYNNIFLYIEENIIQALDRQIARKMNIESRPLKEWITKDEGMHVFGMALYELMDQEGFIEGDETIGDFLVRMYKKGKFKPGRIELLYKEFYNKNN